jgi:small-conductance mechanosensitive channel
MYLLLEQPFKIGDTIKVKDVEGQVTSIEIRTTNIKTEGNFQIVIPNGIVFSEIVTNHTAYRSRLVAIKLILPPDLTMSEASEKIKATLTDYPGEDIIQKPHFAIYLESTAEGKTHIRVEFWTASYEHRHVGSKVAQALKEALPEVEISGVS